MLTRDLLQRWCEQFAQNDFHRNQHHAGNEHRQGEPAYRDAGSTCDRQLTAAGQSAQSQQGSDQRTDRQQLPGLLRHTHQRKPEGVKTAVMPGAGIALLGDEGEQHGERDDHGHHQCGHGQYPLHDVTVEDVHAALKAGGTAATLLRRRASTPATG